ncbi:uncharacterized protein LDX57_011017 [Aspergillus melleus]|uniref:uncharacterized protein n=1 Tax=Aspergillus melleus TaxID=138277 RepID=UPI001E8DEDB8|nr:uncharacterized protein LDX57_011017 [Aspergillus melleus]KAH8433383.1 hypothetical protein LDX57_011017 [Aspergillus melleus]
MDITADGSRVRAVRLIVIEYVEGITMLQVHPNGFSRNIRQRIMKTMIDFESTVYHRKDIVLRDLSPRNVMLLETTDLEPSRHLVFVDFASALFNRKLDYPFLTDENFFLGQYVSSLLRWNKDMAREFLDWIDWDWEPWVEKEYAHTAGTITQGMRDRYSL